MGGTDFSQPGPQEIELHGWLRYHSDGVIRLGRAIGTRNASFWILRAVGQPFANQHRVCVLDQDETAQLLKRIESNGSSPVPVTVRGILFSVIPGEDVHLVATNGGIRCHDSDDRLTEFVATRQAVQRMVEEELARLERAAQHVPDEQEARTMRQ